MAIKTYIRGFERIPIDTLSYAASTNYFLACAQSFPDFSTYLDTKWVIFNNAIYAVIVYDAI